MNLLRNSLLGILAVALTMTSCSRQTIYSHYENISSDGWLRSDSVCFDISPVHEGGLFSETIGLRLTRQYQFMNLSLIIFQQTSSSQQQRTDTLNISIMDEHGQMQGDGINYYQYNMPLKDILLSDGDSLHVTVTHMMRRENLNGISNIGLSLEKKSR
jgi:gliding motility-associated lipoprotein GldH